MFVLDSVDKVGPFFVQHPTDIVNVLCRFREYSEKTNISTFEDFRDPNKTIEVSWPKNRFSKRSFKNDAVPGEVFIICIERTESGAYKTSGEFYRFRDLRWYWIGLL